MAFEGQQSGSRFANQGRAIRDEPDFMGPPDVSGQTSGQFAPAVAGVAASAAGTAGSTAGLLGSAGITGGLAILQGVLASRAAKKQQEAAIKEQRRRDAMLRKQSLEDQARGGLTQSTGMQMQAEQAGAQLRQNALGQLLGGFQAALR